MLVALHESDNRALIRKSTNIIFLPDKSGALLSMVTTFLSAAPCRMELSNMLRIWPSSAAALGANEGGGGGPGGGGGGGFGIFFTCEPH